jgi:hypothetical protein
MCLPLGLLGLRVPLGRVAGRWLHWQVLLLLLLMHLCFSINRAIIECKAFTVHFLLKRFLFLVLVRSMGNHRCS